MTTVNIASTVTPPTIGRTVLLSITEQQAKQINAQRTQAGHATKTGNVAREGDTFPLLIVRVWPHASVNGQLFLDGNDTLWITSAAPIDLDAESAQLGKWRWPERV
jgi:hypothetical protein